MYAGLPLEGDFFYKTFDLRFPHTTPIVKGTYFLYFEGYLSGSPNEGWWVFTHVVRQRV